MKVLIRRALLVSGMVVGAFATGNVLGNFTVAGLKDFDDATNGMALFEPFTDTSGKPAIEQAAVAAAPIDQASGNHVCQGCDAKLHREPEYSDYAYQDAPLAPDNFGREDFGRDEEAHAPQALMAVAPPRPPIQPVTPSLPTLRAIPANANAAAEEPAAAP